MLETYRKTTETRVVGRLVDAVATTNLLGKVADLISVFPDDAGQA